MLFEMISIEAVNYDEYDRACNEYGDDHVELYNFVEECYDLNLFSSSDSLESMLPSGYRLLPEFGAFSFEVTIRCFYGSDKFTLLLYCRNDPFKGEAEGFDEETGVLTTYEDVTSMEQIARILDRYWPEIIAWSRENHGL